MQCVYFDFPNRAVGYFFFLLFHFCSMRCWRGFIFFACYATSNTCAKSVMQTRGEPQLTMCWTNLITLMLLATPTHAPVRWTLLGHICIYIMWSVNMASEEKFERCLVNFTVACLCVRCVQMTHWQMSGRWCEWLCFAVQAEAAREVEERQRRENERLMAIQMEEERKRQEDEAVKEVTCVSDCIW